MRVVGRLLISTLLLLALSVDLQASCNGYKDQFSYEQWYVIEESYSIGKEQNLGWSLAAISIVESSAGKKVTNWREGSFGVYQILMTTAITRYTESNGYEFDPNDSYDTFSLAFKLAFNQNFAAQFAIKELNYWRLQHGDNWGKVWASYNAGWSYARGLAYSNKIAYHIKELQKCTSQEFLT